MGELHLWTVILQQWKGGTKKKAKVYADTMEEAGAKAQALMPKRRVIGVYREDTQNGKK